MAGLTHCPEDDRELFLFTGHDEERHTSAALELCVGPTEATLVDHTPRTQGGPSQTEAGLSGFKERTYARAPTM
jgi:hypothetical protein